LTVFSAACAFKTNKKNGSCAIGAPPFFLRGIPTFFVGNKQKFSFDN